MATTDEKLANENVDKKVRYSMLPGHMGGGPHGLGDPDDQTLRKVEKEILIVKMVKEKARLKCSELVTAFTDCSKTQGLLMPFRCRKEAKLMQECTLEWFQDPQMFRDCREEYLKERSEYRRTGISQKQKRKDSATF